MMRTVLLAFLVGGLQVNAQLWCNVFGGTCTPSGSCTSYINRSNLCPTGQLCCTQRTSVCQAKFKGVCVNQWAPCTNGNKYTHSQTWGQLCPSTSEWCCITNAVTQKPQTEVPVKTTPATGVTVPKAGCGVTNFPPTNNRVVGGTKARKGGWPWQISIRLHGQHTCGGSILAPNWVVTAGHCFLQSQNPSNYKVRAGDLYQGRQDGSEVDHDIEKIVIHHGYNGRSTQNDITLLKLRQPITLGQYVNSVCLPQKSDNFDGRSCWVTGWGLTQGTENQYHLQQFLGRTTSNSQCNNQWGGRIGGGMICFGDGTEGACRGDSGGPMVCQENGVYKLAGVTSWGSQDCTTRGLPNVFTRVSYYRDWIQQQTGL